ncbi:MAG: RNA-binding protein [Gammaproteobacteria bacterium HGW-Gammaproteobacteria-1]|jgi:RNA recognition motif-containing protein|nr:MAG: RNA-binding protein [Gammaproteobacteria bacterium HGW-Gammaproteobacteria-1]
MKTMFVGNLAPETREDDVRELFSQFGTVRGIKIAMDVFSGNCRGFALVDMEGHETRAAIAGLNGTQYKGKALKVTEEQPKTKGRGGKGGRR